MKHRYHNNSGRHPQNRGEVAHVPKVARIKKVDAKAKDDEDNEVSPPAARGQVKRHHPSIMDGLQDKIWEAPH